MLLAYSKHSTRISCCYYSQKKKKRNQSNNEIAKDTNKKEIRLHKEFNWRLI